MGLLDRFGKGGGGSDRAPLLSGKNAAEVIGKRGVDAKVTGVREAPRELRFADIVVDLTIKGRAYAWPLRDGITLGMLIERLGKKEKLWIGKTVKLVTVPGVNKSTGKPTLFINVGK